MKTPKSVSSGGVRANGVPKAPPRDWDASWVAAQGRMPRPKSYRRCARCGERDGNVWTVEWDAAAQRFNAAWLCAEHRQRQLFP